MGGEEWMTTRECAVMIRHRREYVHWLIGKGMLRATQLIPRGRVLVSRKSVEDLLNRRMNRPTKRD